MQSKRVEIFLAALRAGFTFGYSHKEGMMTVALRHGVYSFYEGGEGGYEKREETRDPDAFVSYLGTDLSDDRYRDGFEGYLCRLGYDALCDDDLAAAEEAFELALDWEIEVAHAGIALVLAQRGDLDAAGERLGTFDTLARKRGHAYRPFGHLQAFLSAACSKVDSTQNDRRGCDFWTRILSIQPGRADALYGRGFALEMLERWSEAAADLEAALQTLPQGLVRNLAWQRLAHARFELGTVEEALSGLSQGIAEVEGTSAHNLRQRRVDYLVFLGRHQEALPEFEHLLEGTPSSSALYVQRGDVLEQLGEREAAVADWHQALELNEADEEARERLRRHGL